METPSLELVATSELKNPTGRGWVAAISILLVAFVGIVGAIFNCLGLIDSEHTPQSEEPWVEVTAMLLKLGSFVFFLTGIISFLMWTYRCAHNGHRLEDAARNHTPGWCVGSYFVPIYNLWGPYQGMREIVWNTFRHAEEKSVTGLLIPWWICWVVYNLLDRFGEIPIMGLVVSTSGVISAVLLFFIIHRISKAQVAIMRRGFSGSEQVAGPDARSALPKI